MPLHRVLDLAILVCRAKLHFQEAYRYEKLYDPEKPVIDRVGLQGDAMTVAVCTDNEISMRIFSYSAKRSVTMMNCSGNGCALYPGF
jgi:hypothetical protein